MAKTERRHDSPLAGILQRVLDHYKREAGTEAFTIRRIGRAPAGREQDWIPVDLGIGGRAVHARAVAISRWGALRPEEIRHALRAASADDSSAVPVVIAPYLGPVARRWLRREGMNYVDAAGNVRVVAPGTYVEREGTGTRPTPAAPRQHVNPFSKRASLVARGLLARPGAQGIRELAEETGLAPGWVSAVVGALIEAGYVARERDGVRVTNAAGLLRDWTNVYDWRRNRAVPFVVPFAYHELETRVPAILANLTWALTALSGADWIAPAVQHEQMHVYVIPGEERAAQERLESRLHARPLPRSERGAATLHVVTPYYGRAAFFGAESIRGMSVVSPLQLYLDLVHFPLRGPEAAAAILRTTLAPQLGLSPADVRSLSDERTPRPFESSGKTTEGD